MIWSLFTKKRETAEQKAGSGAPVAILGDIHANLEALKAVLADIKAQGVQQFACTGDIVGYGADPRKCLEIVRNLNCPVVQGNHDFYAATEDSLKDFSLHALNAMLWTREQLSEEEREWLRSLPMTVDLHQVSGVGCQVSGGEATPNAEPRTSNCRLVHSSLLEPAAWHYVLKPEAAKPNLLIQEPEVVFFGHTHVPSHFSFHPATQEFKTVFPLKEGVHQLEPGWKHLINPGSAGQPRDHDPRASYALFDPEARTVEIRRVEYDIPAAQKKIEAAGMPLRNADRLAKGR
jgi:predicted phosphodiesterase